MHCGNPGETPEIGTLPWQEPGAEIHQVYAKEEPLGLRMVLDGVTVLLPTIYDPSELRSDITGKLVTVIEIIAAWMMGQYAKIAS